MPPSVIDAYAAAPPAGFICARKLMPPAAIVLFPAAYAFTVGDTVAVASPP